ncbi:hypothetical protein GF352_03645 [archaeon]|nr:hypothetical protein [archaeon]
MELIKYRGKNISDLIKDGSGRIEDDELYEFLLEITPRKSVFDEWSEDFEKRYEGLKKRLQEYFTGFTYFSFYGKQIQLLNSPTNKSLYLVNGETGKQYAFKPLPDGKKVNVTDESNGFVPRFK